MLWGTSTKVVLTGTLGWVLRSATGEIDDFTVRLMKGVETCRAGIGQILPQLALENDLKSYGAPVTSSIGLLI